VTKSEFSEDLLRGAKAIAQFYYGHERYARRIFHLAEGGKFPIFREGTLICARRSTIREWVQEQERATASRAA
jgi:hypothetical protein